MTQPDSAASSPTPLPQQALEQHQGELAEARLQGSSRRLVECLIACGDDLVSLGRSCEALPHFEEALALARERGDLGRLYRAALYSLGSACVDADDLQRALATLQKAADLSGADLSGAETEPERRITLLSRLATARAERGLAARAQDAASPGASPAREPAGAVDLAAAQDYLDEALHIAEDNQMLTQQADLYYQRGYLLANQAQFAAARQDMQRSVELCATHGHPFGQARSLQALGTLDVHLGQVEQGIASLQQALALVEAGSDPLLLPVALASLAQAELAMGRAGQALAHLGRAAALAEAHRSVPKIAGLLSAIERLLAEARRQLDQPEAAVSAG